MSRRGQGNAISVLILAGVTIAIALALLAYFSGVFNESRREADLTLLRVRAAADLQPVVVYSSLAGSGGLAGCFLYAVSNLGGEPLRVYFTVLPVYETLSGDIRVADGVQYVPVDQSTGRSTAWIYYFGDVDGDGLEGLVGVDADGSLIELSGLAGVDEALPSCDTLASSQALKSYSIPPASAGLEDIITLQGASLGDLYQGSLAYPLPVWELDIGPNGQVKVVVVVNSPVDVEGASLVFMSRVAGDYYYFEHSLLPLQTP